MDQTLILSEIAGAVLSILSRDSKVKVSETELLARIPILAGSKKSLARAVDELETAGLAIAWVESRGQRVVTLSALSASRLRRKLNRDSTRWIPAHREDRSERPVRQRLVGDEQTVLVESDADEILGGLENLADPKAREAVDHLVETEEDIRLAERRGGFVRPRYILGVDAGSSWPLDQRRRGPSAPDPGPNDHPKPPRVEATVCPGCHGQQRPLAYCAWCGWYFAEANIPARIRKTVAASQGVTATAAASERRRGKSGSIGRSSSTPEARSKASTSKLKGNRGRRGPLTAA
jgi:hypothetical protein